MSSDSLITTLLRQKRFKNDMGGLSDEDPSYLDPSVATPALPQANPVPGIMSAQPPAPSPQLQPYSPLEILLMKLGLINNVPQQVPTATAATRG